MVKKILKWVFRVLLFILLVTVIGGYLFMTFSPQFGGTPTEKQKEEYRVTWSPLSSFILFNFMNIYK